MTSAATVVLGGGNTGLSIAAKLSLEGRRVVLWEAPDHLEGIAPIVEQREVRLTGAAGQGVATLDAVTTDPAEALASGDVLVASVPSYAHDAFADLITPHLQERHVLALLPGNLGSLAFAKRLRNSGQSAESRPLLLESDTAPYVCRKLGPDHVHIWGVVRQLGVGALPASETQRALSVLDPLFPGVREYRHVVATGLAALNPIVHPPGVLMNAGRIEYSRGEFHFYEEGVTPGVARVIEALDGERRAIGAALGLELLPVADAFSVAGFGPAGDLWEVINGSRMLTQLKAPGSLDTRWLAEDVPYGLRTWAELGASFDVRTPVTHALITLADAVTGIDSWTSGRSLVDLGISGMTREDLETYLETGVSQGGAALGASSGPAKSR